MTPEDKRLLVYAGLFVVGAIYWGVGNALDDYRSRRWRKQAKKMYNREAATFRTLPTDTEPGRVFEAYHLDGEWKINPFK